MTEQINQSHLKGYNKIQHCETLDVQYLIKNYQAHKEAEKYDPLPGVGGGLQSIETDPEITEMKELADKNVKRAIINVI